MPLIDQTATRYATPPFKLMVSDFGCAVETSAATHWLFDAVRTSMRRSALPVQSSPKVMGPSASGV